MSSYIKKKLKITGMHCTSCAMTIDFDLEDEKGIQKANTSYARQETEVEYDQDVLKEEDIIKVIKKSGYDAIVLDN